MTPGVPLQFPVGVPQAFHAKPRAYPARPMGNPIHKDDPFPKFSAQRDDACSSHRLPPHTPPPPTSQQRNTQHEELSLTHAASAEPAAPRSWRAEGTRSCLCSRHSDPGQSQQALQSSVEKKLHSGDKSGLKGKGDAPRAHPPRAPTGLSWPKRDKSESSKRDGPWSAATRPPLPANPRNLSNGTNASPLTPDLEGSPAPT